MISMGPNNPVRKSKEHRFSGQAQKLVQLRCSPTTEKAEPAYCPTGPAPVLGQGGTIALFKAPFGIWIGKAQDNNDKVCQLVL
eukprot:14789113-Ditylum_brightwellii.AAC.1